MRRHSNLVLVTNPMVNDRRDFERIAAYVREIATDVHPCVVDDAPDARLALRLAARPTFVFSPTLTVGLRLWRGRVLQGRPMGKIAETRALERHGVPVPRSAILTKAGRPELGAFGPYVVLKPEHGARGAEVRIVRKGRVRWRDVEIPYTLPSERWLVQDFVYTGRWPVSYRVLTLFGEPLSAYRCEADRSRRPLEEPMGFRGGARGGGLSIVSTGRGCTFALTDDSEVLSLARRAHGAFRRVPLLGVDIVRDATTGRPYVIEVNAEGRAWHFSSSAGRSIQADNGLDFEKQFDGLRLAARVLTEQARARAR